MLELFGYNFNRNLIGTFVAELAEFYLQVYDHFLDNIKSLNLIFIDETKIN